MIKIINPSTYKLALLKSIKIYNRFHTNLLRPAATNALLGQIPPPAPLVIINGEQEWEVEDILDSRLYRRQLQYRVQWTNHPPDLTWYPARNLANAPNIIDDFYKRYPEKPGPLTTANN